MGDHGTAAQAIDYVLNHDVGCLADDWLVCWQHGDLKEWPEFYVWLSEQDGLAPPRPAAREAAYAAIDSERDYQAVLERNEVKQQRPMEQLALVSKIIRDAEDHWYSQPGQLPMDFARKIGGVATRMLEEHGAPLRIIPRN